MEQKMERRQFLRLATGAAVIGTAASLVGCGAAKGSGSGDSQGDSVKGWTNINFSEDVDVLVVGAGASGLSCAYMAAKGGLKTLVVDKQVTYGGDAATSANTWMARYSDICKEQRPDDYMPLDTMLANYDTAYGDDPDFCQLWKNWTTYAAEWHKLITHEFGVEWQEKIPAVYKGMFFPAGGIGQGKALWDKVYTNVQNAGAAFRFSTRASYFIVDSKNNPVGIRCWDSMNEKWVDVKAKAFALCAGGFASNQAMITEYYPEMVNKACVTTQSMGEGIQLGLSVGGAVYKMGQDVNYNPNVECIHVSQATGRSFSILNNGKRFYAETAIHNGPEYCLKAGAYSWWAIWDNSITNGPSAIQVKTSESIRKTGNSVQELATAMGMPMSTLQAAFDDYNAICDAQSDPAFGRTMFLEKLEPPYYAVQLYPVRYKTAGGLKVSPQGELQDESGTVISGIYAAGQTGGTSDIMPAVGSGMMIGENIVSYVQSL